MIKDKDNREQRVIDFLNNVTAVSYSINDDADGSYFNVTDRLVKSDNKVNLSLYFDDILKSNFILTHQRIATSGRTDKYHQPFNSDEFVFLHNGIISEFAENEQSDTYGFMTRFIEAFKGTKKKTREDKVIYAIKKVLDDVSGSYSIGLYDKKKEILYYFKSYSTDIKFYKNKKYIYITTSDFNERFLTLLTDKKFKEMDIKNYTIYSIEKDKKIYQIGKIKEHEYEYKGKYSEKDKEDNTESFVYDETAKRLVKVKNGYYRDAYGMTRLSDDEDVVKKDGLADFGNKDSEERLLTQHEQKFLKTQQKRVENLSNIQRNALRNMREALKDYEMTCIDEFISEENKDYVTALERDIGYNNRMFNADKKNEFKTAQDIERERRKELGYYDDEYMFED